MLAKHGFGAYYNADSLILILGSFPSVKSREQSFYYAHPQNRFWKILSLIYHEEIANDISAKKIFLKKHQIALYDVIEECEIVGSADASIKNVVPSDLNRLLKHTKIKQIYTNGNLANKLYQKYQLPLTNIEAIKLPSSSPANAAKSLEQLVEEWKIITE